MIEYLRVGIIVNSHGLKGEVKVMPTTDDISRFDYLEKAFIQKNSERTEIQVTNVKYLNKFVILKFEGYDDIDDILKFKNCDIMINREDAIKLNDNENFVGDIIGCLVYDDNVEYGYVKDVIFTGANDVYVVDHNGKNLLIPVIDECVLEVDVVNQRIKVNMLEGLLDL